LIFTAPFVLKLLASFKFCVMFDHSSYKFGRGIFLILFNNMNGQT
jgi:hypothetical protein